MARFRPGAVSGPAILDIGNLFLSITRTTGLPRGALVGFLDDQGIQARPVTFAVHFSDDLGFGFVPERHLSLREDVVEGTQAKSRCDAGAVKELVEPGAVDFPAIAEGGVG